MRALANVFRQPLLHFVVLAVAAYLIYAWLGKPGTGEDNVIRVTAADVSRFDAAWRARWGRPPTEEELTGIVTQYVREVALYKHAVAMGLDENDMVVRRTLAQKLQSMTQNLLELNLAPTEEDLQAYFEANIESYQPPDLLTFTQIFVDPDRRGDDTVPDAKAMLADLNARDFAAEEVDDMGDPFLLQRYYPEKSQLDISKQFGQGFTESIFELEVGVWHGPVLSGYGVHLVYVHDRQQSPKPSLDDVRDFVQRDWIDEQRREIQERFVAGVVASYDVVLDEAVPADVEQRLQGEPPE